MNEKPQAVDPDMLKAAPKVGGVEVIPYEPRWAEAWDALVARSRNGCFKLTRNFLAYHGERFADRSLMFWFEGRLGAVLGLHEQDQEWVSHRGLPFGGLVAAPELTTAQTYAIFAALEVQMRRAGIYTLRYTPVPAIYHTHPFEDDRFILYNLGARVAAMKFSARARLPRLALMQDRMKKYLRQAVPQIRVESDVELGEFWAALTRYLEWRHEAMPVHSQAEMADLLRRFPENIKTLAIRGPDQQIVAGSLIFLTQHVIRLQYGFGGAAPEAPKSAVLALDMAAIERYGAGREWIDFGTSMSPQDGSLDLRLHSQKERSGARGMCVETWLWQLERDSAGGNGGNNGKLAALLPLLNYPEISAVSECVPRLFTF